MSILKVISQLVVHTKSIGVCDKLVYTRQFIELQISNDLSQFCYEFREKG